MVLSGNRCFGGRIHPDVRANYLTSPPLVLAYAVAGSMRHDLVKDPLGLDNSGKPVCLQELWPDKAEIDAAVAEHVSPTLYSKSSSSRRVDLACQIKLVAFTGHWLFVTRQLRF